MSKIKIMLSSPMANKTDDEINYERNEMANLLFDYYEINKLLNELNGSDEQLKKENEQLKQFQEQVAEVIESKMGDNVCNDYKMEVLKEIWNELELDEVWFE